MEEAFSRIRVKGRKVTDGSTKDSRYRSRAAKDVFSTMLGLEIEVGEPFAEKGSPAESQKVVALIGLAGQWIGTGVIGCSPEFACRIASIMLMAEYQAVNEDVLDAMAEMANMIFGNVKTELEEELGGARSEHSNGDFRPKFCHSQRGATGLDCFPAQSRQRRNGAEILSDAESRLSDVTPAQCALTRHVIENV